MQQSPRPTLLILYPCELPFRGRSFTRWIKALEAPNPEALDPETCRNRPEVQFPGLVIQGPRP